MDFFVLYTAYTAHSVDQRKWLKSNQPSALAEVYFVFILHGFREQYQNYSLIHLIFIEGLLCARLPYLVEASILIIMLYSIQKIYK